MNDKAFEKWYADSAMPLEAYWFEREIDGEYKLPYVEDTWRGWQAAKADSEQKISEWKNIADQQLRIITVLKGVCEDMGTTDMVVALGRKDTHITELQAHINDLREALEENHYCNSSDKAINLYNAAISKTPAQSLQEHDNEVIERCACECENHWDVDSAAETIRKLKV